MKDEFGYNFPQLPSKVLTESKTYNEKVCIPGDLDPEWEDEKTGILLINIEGRNYFSVPTEMTLTLLKNAIGINGKNSVGDYDIKEETQLDQEFVNELLTRMPGHLDKYNQDNTYLTYLGNLPEAPEFLVVEEENATEENDPSVGIQTS